jgi:hypothetical protein
VRNGPFSRSQIGEFIVSNEIEHDTLVWKQGMKEWLAANEIKELQGFFAMVPPPIIPEEKVESQASTDDGNKSHMKVEKRSRRLRDVEANSTYATSQYLDSPGWKFYCWLGKRGGLYWSMLWIISACLLWGQALICFPFGGDALFTGFIPCLGGTLIGAVLATIPWLFPLENPRSRHRQFNVMLVYMILVMLSQGISQYRSIKDHRSEAYSQFNEHFSDDELNGLSEEQINRIQQTNEW